MMQPGEFYRERIGFFWGWLAAVLFIGMTIMFLVLFFVQRSQGPIGDNPAPDWLYLVMPAFFFITGLLLLNFTSFTVSADARGITAGYGRFRYFVAWSNIESAELDLRPALFAFGGWGIRMGWRNGGWMVIYNVMGTPLMLLKLKQGKSKYFGFSTKRPDEVMALIDTWKR